MTMRTPEIRKLSDLTDDLWICEINGHREGHRGIGKTPGEAYRAWAEIFGDEENFIASFSDPEWDTWWRPPTLEPAPASRSRSVIGDVVDKVVSIFTKRAA